MITSSFYLYPHLESHAITASTLWTIWAVLLSWTVSSFNVHLRKGIAVDLKRNVRTNRILSNPYLMLRTCGSGISSFVTISGPSGQKASIVFPSSHCPPFFRSCQSRALTSWATVYPKTWSSALSTEIFFPFLPITTASSTSKSSSWDYKKPCINNKCNNVWEIEKILAHLSNFRVNNGVRRTNNRAWKFAENDGLNGDWNVLLFTVIFVVHTDTNDFVRIQYRSFQGHIWQWYPAVAIPIATQSNLLLPMIHITYLSIKDSLFCGIKSSLFASFL